MARTKHSNEDYLRLLAELRKRAEWYDGGHGHLHGEAADAIAELIGDSGLEVPPGSQIPPPETEVPPPAPAPLKSQPPERKASEEDLEEDLEQDMEEEMASPQRPHSKAKPRHR